MVDGGFCCGFHSAVLVMKNVIVGWCKRPVLFSLPFLCSGGFAFYFPFCFAVPVVLRHGVGSDGRGMNVFIDCMLSLLMIVVVAR